jgi:hypothetical protein
MENLHHWEEGNKYIGREAMTKYEVSEGQWENKYWIKRCT